MSVISSRLIIFFGLGLLLSLAVIAVVIVLIVYFANKKHGCILIVNEFQNMAALQHLVDFKRDFIGQISQAESV